MKVRDIMNEKVVSVSPDETVREAAEKLAEHKISGAPVVNSSGKVVGILSEADIMNALKSRTSALRMVYPSLSLVSVSFVEEDKQVEVAKAFHDVGSMKVSAVMHTKPLTVAPTDEIDSAVKLMNQNNVNRLPVVKDDKVVGIVTRADVIRGFYKGRK